MIYSTYDTIIEIMIISVTVLGAILTEIFNGDKARRKRFLGRAELCPDEFYQQYYEKSALPKDLVIEILNDVAHALFLPAALLRPTDRFTKELASEPGWEFGDGLGLMEMKLDILLRIKDPNYYLPDLNKLDDYIRLVIELNK
ncbi:MAG: hypothetical protein L7F77_09440 [Candidatus Magnetominusculus sp. LBB02]|nr:hypothetical protein [Candidatus Magnetominusculus sp. LBB02]